MSYGQTQAIWPMNGTVGIEMTLHLVVWSSVLFGGSHIELRLLKALLRWKLPDALPRIFNTIMVKMRSSRYGSGSTMTEASNVGGSWCCWLLVGWLWCERVSVLIQDDGVDCLKVGRLSGMSLKQMWILLGLDQLLRTYPSWHSLHVIGNYCFHVDHVDDCYSVYHCFWWWVWFLRLQREYRRPWWQLLQYQ